MTPTMMGLIGFLPAFMMLLGGVGRTLWRWINKPVWQAKAEEAEAEEEDKPKPQRKRSRSLATEIKNREKIDSDKVWDGRGSDENSIMELSDEEIAEFAEQVPF